MIKSSDWIIDLGPEVEKGGYILFEGEAEKLLTKKNNDTAFCLREYKRQLMIQSLSCSFNNWVLRGWKIINIKNFFC